MEFAAPPFKPAEALVLLKRQLRDLKPLAERGDHYDIKGRPVIRLEATEAAIEARLLDQIKERGADASAKTAFAPALVARLAADGQSLEWLERTPQGAVRHTTEPGTTTMRRLGVELMSVLPIEWLL